MKKEPNFPLRIEKPLKLRLQKIAKQKRMSLNSLILTFIDKSIK